MALLDFLAGGNKQPSQGGFSERMREMAPYIAMMDPRNAGLGAAMLQSQQGRQKAEAQQQQANQTVSWLKSNGVGDSEAAYLASDPAALRAWYGEFQSSGKPDWQLQSIYDDQGREQKVMMDMKSGRYNAIGGAKTDTLSPEAEQQKARIAQAGRAETNVNVGAEKGYDKTVGEGYGKRFLDIQNEAQTAQRALTALNVMEGAMSDPGFYSGAGATTVATLKRIGSSLGMDPEGISSIETFNAMAKQAALDSMGGSLGTGFSNADRDFVLDQVPNLANTPEGNRRLIEVQKSINTRKQQIAQLARDYATQNDGRIDAGFDDYLARWAEQNPMFSGTESSQPRRLRFNPYTGELE